MTSCLICDTGTGMIKAGFSGDHFPRVSIPNMLGHPTLRFDQELGDQQLKDTMIGDEVIPVRSMLEINRPIQNGVIQNWEDMEAIWDYTFKKLGVTDASQLKIVQTEAAMNPTANREKMLQIMFERYGFAAVNISVQAVLALNAQGLMTGFVVDSGDGVTHLVPVTEGYVQPHLVGRLNIAGRHVTHQLTDLLVGRGYHFNSTADFETVREMKQKLCYVAYDLEAEKRLARETTTVDQQYTLPDSKVIRVGSERFMAPEILFNPHLHMQHDGPGLGGLIFQTIRNSDINVQKDYYNHIILSGGSTMFPGFSSRLEKEIKQLYLEEICKGDKARLAKLKVHVEDPPRRMHMVFQGASLLADALKEGCHEWFITRAEFNEKGAACVHRLITTKLS